MRILTFFMLFLLVLFSYGQKSAVKQDAIDIVEKLQLSLTSISDSIWQFAELAMQENKSSKSLSDFAIKNGFKVTLGVAEIPTAFVAEYGSGKPIIGIMGEFDALPGLSQDTTPFPQALKNGKNGHGCGHNMFGAASLGAAIAIKELIQTGKLKGTIRFYGTPAEEDKAGKVYMAKAGLFNDLDVCLDWHPSDEIAASMQSSQAVVDYNFEFIGKSAHAAYDPWNGRSALDAAELFNVGINFLREHIKPSVRMHYVYRPIDGAPNVIPNESKVWLWIRDSKRNGVKDVEKRVFDIAKGAALMAGVDYNIKLNSGLYEILINETGANTLQKNLELLGPITYNQNELDFANKIMTAYGEPFKGIDGNIHPIKKTNETPEGGSTDVGDISYIVPEISLTVTTAPKGAPWHSWVVVACGGKNTIGHKGLIYASKALALTMIDLYEKPQLITKIKEEFLQRKGTEIWTPQLPPGPPPVHN
ncbi:MAG: amidohydrolase [Alphaproteobacteria bacterium]|nr:amidohydrolase [Alphaproteobacteria bacterium]